MVDVSSRIQLRQQRSNWQDSVVERLHAVNGRAISQPKLMAAVSDREPLSSATSDVTDIESRHAEEGQRGRRKHRTRSVSELISRTISCRAYIYSFVCWWLSPYSAATNNMGSILSAWSPSGETLSLSDHLSSITLVCCMTTIKSKHYWHFDISETFVRRSLFSPCCGPCQDRCDVEELNKLISYDEGL